MVFQVSFFHLPYFRFSGFRHSSSGRRNLPVLANQHIIKPDFAAAVFGCHNQHQIPVDGGFIAVGGILVAVAGGEMDRAGNLFIKKNVVHGLCDIGVYANGKFAHISCALVRVEYLFQTLLVIPVAVHDFPVLEGQAYIFKGKAVVFGGGIIGNHTVDGITHRCGINLAVGDIAAAGTLDGRNILDGEGNIRIPCHQTHAVCFVHQFHQMLHGIAILP